MIKPVQTRNRSKYRCPDGLKRLIELVNFVPPNRPLPHLNEMWWGMLVNGEQAEINKYKRWHEMLEQGNLNVKEAKGLEQNLIKLHGRQYAEYPPLTEEGYIKQSLKGLPANFIKQNGPIESYNKVRLIRMALRDIANLALVPPVDRPDYLLRYQQVYVEPDIGFLAKYLPFGVRAWNHYSMFDLVPGFMIIQPAYGVFLSLTEKNQVYTPLPAYWLHDLIGVDVSRLRVCDVCDRLFWAKQGNSWACSDRCNVTRRQRKFRKSAKESGTTQGQKRALGKRSAKEPKGGHYA